MFPKDILIKDYTYQLPEGRIAGYPLTERDHSKLLIYKEAHISEDIYENIAQHIPENSLIIFNNTKVVEARLLFQKPTGGFIEVFCLEPYGQYPDITMAMLQKEKVLWHCLVGGVSKWRYGQTLQKKITRDNNQIVLNARYIDKRTDSFVIELSWSPHELSFAEVLHNVGAIPLPPYIKRKVEEADNQRYQTVYADTDGSVASPTAGLHFTDKIFARLREKDIQTGFVTLHIGAGTFKPVKAETLIEHEMHAEFIYVSKITIECILRNLDNNIIAVGTTSLRTIETLYWLGVKIIVDPSLPSALSLSQWEAYELAKHPIPAYNALQSLLSYVRKNNWESVAAKTQLLIVPGYQFKIVGALVTNFHQPQSTLLLLVAALIGHDWQTVYEYALQNNFRFLSYGDGSLLWGKKISFSSAVDQ